MIARQNIISALAYFDIFHYPLTRAEVFSFLQERCTVEEFNTALTGLLKESSIYQHDDLYSLREDTSIITRRRKGNIAAQKLLPTAGKVASILAMFPFVRGIGVSGSLSKKFADESSDIDFFIITAKNRLWIARTLMHVLKKLSFLFNRQHLLCMNYYVDEEMLRIREKNIFTATEVVTLLPLRGTEAFRQFYSCNDWCRNFLPHHPPRFHAVKPVANPFFKRAAEFILNHAAADSVDGFLMRITSRRWQQKTKKNKLNNRGIIMGMDASRHWAKPDPVHFQKKILDQYKHKTGRLLALTMGNEKCKM